MQPRSSKNAFIKGALAERPEKTDYNPHKTKWTLLNYACELAQNENDFDLALYAISSYIDWLIIFSIEEANGVPEVSLSHGSIPVSDLLDMYGISDESREVIIGYFTEKPPRLMEKDLPLGNLFDLRDWEGLFEVFKQDTTGRFYSSNFIDDPDDPFSGNPSGPFVRNELAESLVALARQSKLLRQIDTSGSIGTIPMDL